MSHTSGRAYPELCREYKPCLKRVRADPFYLENVRLDGNIENACAYPGLPSDSFFSFLESKQTIIDGFPAVVLAAIIDQSHLSIVETDRT